VILFNPHDTNAEVETAVLVEKQAREVPSKKSDNKKKIKPEPEKDYSKKRK